VTNHDARTFAMLLRGIHVNGELATVSDRFAPIANRLQNTQPIKTRSHIFEGFWIGQADGKAIVEKIASVDLDAPPVEEEPQAPRFATAADLRKLMKDTRWVWDLWIPTGSIFGLAAFEGCGKTRLMLDLHKRAWNATEWPDGSPVRTPPHRPALWLCSDAHQLELVEALGAYGLPDESLVFPTPADEPFGGDNIDDPELVKEGGVIEQAIEATKPWCLVIDTLTNATARNLSDQQVMKALGDPLKRIAQKYDLPVALVLHVAKDGGVLGRRIRGLTRTIIKLENPNSEGDSPGDGRLRFWVDKSYAAKPTDENGKPLVLGVTMGSEGNTYDNNPPKREEAGKPMGRPANQSNAAEAFIIEALTSRNNQLYNELSEEFVDRKLGSSATFSRAKNKLQAEGRIKSAGGPGTRQQMTLYLVPEDF
jgi:hypothetical protein